MTIDEIADRLYERINQDIPPAYKGSWRRIVLVKTAQEVVNMLEAEVERFKGDAAHREMEVFSLNKKVEQADALLRRCWEALTELCEWGGAYRDCWCSEQPNSKSSHSSGCNLAQEALAALDEAGIKND